MKFKTTHTNIHIQNKNVIQENQFKFISDFIVIHE